jgi:AcrR family transcriptional regulator
MSNTTNDAQLDRRTRKRLATRQAISDAATCLFMERGFDQVTIDEIANAADVGRMTVFNHFPRKEDMFFDREEEARNLAFDTIRSRPSGTSPIEALGALAHQMIEQPSEAFPLFEHTQAFVETALASETLRRAGARCATISFRIWPPSLKKSTPIGTMICLPIWPPGLSPRHGARRSYARTPSSAVRAMYRRQSAFSWQLSTEASLARLPRLTADPC